MSMEQLPLKSNEVNKDALKYDYVKEKLENHKSLRDLYNQVLGLDDKENKKIEDLSGVKTYLDSIKDKSWNEIKQEGSTWSFAIQLFLKSQGLYDGRIDGLYMTTGQPESRTRAAVRKFQEANGLLKDGWAGPETIKKMLEKLDVKPANPETDMNKMVNTPAIKNIFDNLSDFDKALFKVGQKTITTSDYNYNIVEGQLTRKNNVTIYLAMTEEVLLVDGKWGKKIEEKKDNSTKPIPEVKKSDNGGSSELLKGITKYGNGNMEIADNNKKKLLTKELNSNFYKRDGFKGKYELNGNKIYYVGKDHGLKRFNGTARSILSDARGVSEEFKKEITNIINNQNNMVKNYVSNWNLDYNGIADRDVASRNEFINYIVENAKSCNVILTPSVLTGLKLFLKNKNVVTGLFNKINYGSTENNNDRINDFIKEYLEKNKITL